MTEVVSSFFDNLKQKSTNPFFGTLILVYVIRNWELIYTLFIFDSECTMNDKKHYIYNYIHTHADNLNIFYNAGIALATYLIGLTIMVGTRFIVDWKDDTVTPWLEDKALHDKVVPKERLTAMTKERDIFLDDLIKERERFSSVELDNRTLRENIATNATNFNELNKQYQELVKNHNSTTTTLAKRDAEILKLNFSVAENNDLRNQNRLLILIRNIQVRQILNTEKTPATIQTNFTELTKINLINTFKRMFEDIINDEYTDEIEFDTEICVLLVNLGLIRKISNDKKYTTYNTYFTSGGVQLYKFLIDNQVQGKD